MNYSSHDINSIVEITNTELIYREDRGDLISIDLGKCRDRYIKYINSHLAEYPELKGKPIENNSGFKCVADRYFSDQGYAYFEFYEWPRVRFEIRMKNKAIKRFLPFVNSYYQRISYQQFHAIQLLLQSAGWTTYDLS